MNSEIVEDQHGQQKVRFEDGTEYNCSGYAGETRVGYMCSVDFNTEMGNHIVLRDGTPEGAKVYDSLEELRRARGCIDECGYTKVILVAVEVSPGKRPSQGE